MYFPDHSATGNQAEAQPKQLTDRTDEFKGKERNEDEKKCLEGVEKSLACASILVEGLSDAKKGKYDGRKLDQGKADQDFVSQDEANVFI